MQYVNLGKTGLKVSRLCLGMMSYGSKTWREWLLEENEAELRLEENQVVLDLKPFQIVTLRLKGSMP